MTDPVAEARALRNALSIVWPHAMAYAEGGGSGGPEMRDMRHAADLMRAAMGGLPMGCDDPGAGEDDEP